MRVVLDANVWLSGMFWKEEAYNLIERLTKEKIKIVLTRNILLEISEVLDRESKFQKFLKDRKETIDAILRTIISFSTIIASKTRVKAIPEDPADNKILECAIDGKADYIISYDNHLLKLKEYKNIKIVTPSEFTLILSRNI